VLAAAYALVHYACWLLGDIFRHRYEPRNHVFQLELNLYNSIMSDVS
jgi:hypothetical protein